MLKYKTIIGSSAIGIDLPDAKILTDIKVTSIKQPQSSCPFKDAKQKIFGLGYNLLVFVYDKIDDPSSKTSTLEFVSCAFVSKERTADYTTTFRLREMLNDNANLEDVVAYLNDKNIPADDITLQNLAELILSNPPEQGYL
ncbi:MAG: restriction endonuclease, partial [Bacteroidales bacterium]|nr:restriction endonuclease [Bacteroidales bacterium]